MIGSAAPGAEVPLSSVTGLESGSILRVRARADGLAGDLEWNWVVELEGASSGTDEVVVTPLDDTRSVMDISLAKAGVYNIMVRVKGASPCRDGFQHPAVRAPSAPSFIFRVTPPAGSVATGRAPH